MLAAGDKRAWTLAPTHASRRAFDAMGAAFAGINALMDEAFPGTDIDRAAKGLRRLIGLLEAEGEE